MLTWVFSRKKKKATVHFQADADMHPRHPTFFSMNSANSRHCAGPHCFSLCSMSSWRELSICNIKNFLTLSYWQILVISETVDSLVGFSLFYFILLLYHKQCCRTHVPGKPFTPAGWIWPEAELLTQRCATDLPWQPWMFPKVHFLPVSPPGGYFFLKKFIYLAAPGLGMWDLVSRSGIEPRSPVLGAWRLSLWTTREVPSSSSSFF